MKSTVKTLAAATLITLSLNAQATLVDNGLHTYDDISGLSWLDLTETNNLSYDYVSSQLATAGIWAGYRYASSDELYDLLTNFNTSATQPNIYASPIDPRINNLVNLLGNNMLEYGASFVGSLGLTHDAGQTAGQHSRLGVYFYNNNNYFELTLGQFLISDDAAYSYLGHYLIKDNAIQEQAPCTAGINGCALNSPAAVPVPAAVWLFASGLLGLIAVSRRKETAIA